MSGVFGYLGDAHAWPARGAVERMGARMRHQPYYVVESAAPTPGVGLGRIGIGIFNSAPQPVHSADGQLWSVFCGELYHQEGRRAELARAGALASDADDAQLALCVYQREGAAGLTRLEGAFTVAVWDGRAAELVLANDRYGLYPHYVAHVGGGFAFGPEIKGVLEAPGVPRRLDLTALAEYVRFQQLLGDRTWFTDVELLPPASLLRYRPADDRLSRTRYWDWDAIGNRPTISFPEAVEECTRLFQRAVDAMIASRRIGVYLSGGLDSRLILGFIGGRVPVTTITYGAPGSRDAVYAAELARRAGSQHHWFPFRDGRWVLEQAPLHLALTEGLHGWPHAHGMSTLAEARKLIDVNLSGWLGGPILGSKNAARHAAKQAFREAPGEVALLQQLYDGFCQQFTWPGLTEAEAETLLGGRGDARLRGLAFDSLRAELARTAHYPADRRWDYFSLRQHQRRSLQNLIVFPRSAIEVRCPYLDYDFVAFVFSLPALIRTTPDLRRAIITRRLGYLATVPHDKDNRLPHSNELLYHGHATRQRAKGWINRHLAPIFPDRPRLYADYEQWLRTDLRAWAEGILFDRRSLERGLFDPDAVRALWERHLSGRELWTIGKIAPLITIELVLRDLYDSEAGAAP